MSAERISLVARMQKALFVARNTSRHRGHMRVIQRAQAQLLRDVETEPDSPASRFLLATCARLDAILTDSRSFVADLSTRSRPEVEATTLAEVNALLYGPHSGGDKLVNSLHELPPTVERGAA